MLKQYLAGTPLGARIKRVRSLAGLGPAHSAAFERRLTWILGSPRSGSTWLFNLLLDHEAVVGIDEPLVGWYLGPFLCDLPGGDARTLSSADFTLRLAQSDKYSHFFAEQFSDVWVPGLGRLVRERFFAQALRHDSAVPMSQRQVVIKEPNGSQSADVISRALPHSRLLLLLRDGRDVVDSDLAANRPGAWVSRQFPGMRGIAEDERLEFVVQSAQKWLWRTEVVQRACRTHPGPTRVMRYEDILRDPVTRLRELLAWMGLEVDELKLHSSVKHHSFENIRTEARGPAEFYRAASPGGWKDNLQPEEQAAVHNILGDKLRELGYAT